MSLNADNFQETYAAWLDAGDPKEKAKLESILRTSLRDTWRVSEAGTRKAILDFVVLTMEGDFDLVLEALRDRDTEVATLALSTTALLVWNGVKFEPERLGVELDAFAMRHPDWRHVCTSISRRL
jgi:hypothetical protein